MIIKNFFLKIPELLWLCEMELQQALLNAKLKLLIFCNGSLDLEMKWGKTVMNCQSKQQKSGERFKK